MHWTEQFLLVGHCKNSRSWCAAQQQGTCLACMHMALGLSHSTSEIAPLPANDCVNDSRLAVPWKDSPRKPVLHVPLGFLPEDKLRLPPEQVQTVEGKVFKLSVYSSPGADCRLSPGGVTSRLRCSCHSLAVTQLHTTGRQLVLAQGRIGFTLRSKLTGS